MLYPTEKPHIFAFGVYYGGLTYRLNCKGWVLALVSRRCLLGSIYWVVQHMFSHHQRITPRREAYARKDAITCYRINVIHADSHPQSKFLEYAAIPQLWRLQPKKKCRGCCRSFTTGVERLLMILGRYKLRDALCCAIGTMPVVLCRAQNLIAVRNLQD